MKALQIETGIIPGEAAANLPDSKAEAEKRATGFLSMLAERFREPRTTEKTETILVVPFANSARAKWLPSRIRVGRRNRRAAGADLFTRGAAVERADDRAHCADGSLASVSGCSSVGTGRQLPAFGAGIRSELAAAGGGRAEYAAGGTIRVASLDLVAVQTEIATKFLRRSRRGPAATGGDRAEAEARPSLPGS